MKKHKVTFAEIVAETKATVVPVTPTVRLGAFNRSGDLFDPAGNLLEMVSGELDGPGALKALRSGAQVAFETCGCGGGCGVRWLSVSDRASALETGQPTVETKPKAPTWVELWRGADGDVVFAHGEVRWGAGLDW